MILALVGCSGFSSRTSATYYTVRSGDTVYSIAWSVGVDYHQLAAWNGISSSYTIRPGQKLRIRPPGQGDSRRSRSTKKSGHKHSYHRVKSGDTLYRIALKYGVSVAQLKRWNRLGKSQRIYPGQKLWLGDSRVARSGTQKSRRKQKKSKNTSVARASSNTAAPRRSAIKWTWPVRGKILSHYEQSAGRKGINIGGNGGERIRAAAAGTIVYQGSGLRGYGRLIIVKHNNDFLSAYAHCDSFVLKEGSKVKRGAVIAKLGASGTSRNQLHFEIRYRGNPVNPIGYLPRLN